MSNPVKGISGRQLLQRPREQQLTAEQWRELRALLGIEWLPRGVRNAVMQALGLNVREEQRHNAEIRGYVLWTYVEYEKRRMRSQGDRPRGGLHDSAVAAVAKRFDISIENVKQTLHRYKPSAQFLDQFDKPSAQFLEQFVP